MDPVWLIDCDNTLYPAGNGLFDRVNELIIEYMRDVVGIPEKRVDPLRLAYWEKYGVTLGGLMAEHGVDPDHYLAYVHDVPMGDYLAPDPLLAEALNSLPGRKAIFTNATTEHARNVMSHLNIGGLVEEIYDIRYFDFIPKPRVHAYEKVISGMGVDPSECWFVEDAEGNLKTGKEMGMTGVLVAPEAKEGYLHVERFHQLPHLFESYKSANF